ncbi:type 1 fimbrial protein [Salmonella enterica subsp. enterica]|nr:type 1 fimbrial protein [Salmonella enterica]EKC5019924.1 type 1 fimbrial protein [Salmonella enterica subsp. enterica]EKD0710737.1 type 1 fimbrial protein [Salmonella enterica]
MKIKNRLFLLGAAMAVMSSSAFADTAGTQTFTATVTADTCTIANLNQAVDLGNVLKAEYAGLSNWNAPANVALVSVNFDVTGCGNNITTVNVTPTFNAESGSAYVRFVKNAGTAAGIAFDTAKLSNADFNQNRIWQNGVTKAFTLTNGAVQVPVTGILSKNGQAVTAGTLDFQMTFAFDFV